MPDANVPDGDHLMRFVPRGQQVRDADTDEFKGILNTAFQLRPSDKGGLSVTWVEHYGLKQSATIAIAASHFRDSLDKRKLPTQGYFAIGESAATRATAAEHGKKIRLVPAPIGTNTGHVEIHRFSDEDRKLLDALALEVYTEHVPVAGMQLLPPLNP